MKNFLASHPLGLYADFRRFFAGRLISTVGDKFFTIALSWWVLSLDGGSDSLHLGTLLALNTLPMVLFGPLMGTLADRWNRKFCMLLADGARMVLVGALLTMVALGKVNLPLIYLLVFGIGFFAPLFEAASNSCLEQLTDPEHVASAAAVNASAVELSNVLGAALGGAALGFLGTSGGLGINALSFGLSFLLVFSIARNLSPPPAEERESYTENFRRGFGYLFQNPSLGLLLLLFGMVNFFAAPLMLLIPLMVKDVLHAPVLWVGLFEGSFALGAVAVALGLSALPKGNAHLRIFWGLLLFGISLGAFGALRQPWVQMLILFGGGCCFSLINAPALGYFQEQVPLEMRGRFFAILTTLAYAAMPLAFLFNGYITGVLPLPLVLLINGAGVALLSLGVLGIRKLALQ